VEAKQAEREAKRLQPDFLHDYLKDFHQISEPQAQSNQIVPRSYEEWIIEKILTPCLSLT